MNNIQGIYAASLSVFNKDLSINIERTIKHADFLIDNGCHGVVLLGSTGQSQLISISEKIKLINSLSKSSNFQKFIIGTGVNSLGDTINLIKISMSNSLNQFLIMPPAYYKYTDKDVINYFSKIIENIIDCRIILYNFEYLSGYKFSTECVYELVKRFPDQIIGVKDSTYNLYKSLKIDNFSIMLGSDEKLINGLENGSSGIISATCNVTSKIARQVYDDFKNNRQQTVNVKLSKIRKIFENYNLISGLHTFMASKNKIFNNLLPPLSLLNEKNKKKIFEDLSKIEFNMDY